MTRILLPVFIFALSLGNAHSQTTQRPQVLLDTYYNHEVDEETGRVQHYTWDDTSEMRGYSQFGELFERHGASLAMLDDAPTIKRLKQCSVYIIVDPDNIQDNPTPNYMDRAAAKVIARWVKKGGHLLVLANDRDNCDLEHINILMDKFGLHFNDTTMMQLDVPTREKPENMYPLQGTLKGAENIFMRGTTSISCGKDAHRLVWTRDNDTIIAETSYGKGLVIAIADPWAYNEYIGHAFLPGNYDNASPAELIVERLLGK